MGAFRAPGGQGQVKILYVWQVAAGSAMFCVVALLGGCESAVEPAHASVSRVGVELDDDAISRSVVAALKGETEFSLRAVKVSTSAGDVVLSGKLASHAQVDRSLAIAMLVNGVQRVENRLRAPDPLAAPERGGREKPGPASSQAARF